MSDPFAGLPRKHFGAILADPPWAFQTWWSGRSNKLPSPKKKFSYPSRATESDYDVMREPELSSLPVEILAANDCVLFLWTCWPVLEWSLRTIKDWGFEFKTCGFCWVKARANQIEMFNEDIDPHMTLGYWTRSNSEVCLLATRGKPKRQDAGIKQAIIEPRREHSRKPDEFYSRVEAYSPGPRVELFARQAREWWTPWGNE
ncbi:MAG TPA: MT-A70 family methyltransferase, partial [Pirellulales bacterium]